MLYPKYVKGIKSAPEIVPDRKQTERTQFAQKTLKKKVTGEKHIICLYFSLDILFSQHLSSLFL